MGIANTGTGKTALAIPLIDKVLKDPKTKVLIMAPTRKLAIQIESELKSFAQHLGVHSVVCVGGAQLVAKLPTSVTNHFVVVPRPVERFD